MEHLEREFISAIYEPCPSKFYEILADKNFDPSNGESIHLKDSEALITAITEAHPEFVGALLKDGRCDPTVSDNYPLHVCFRVLEPHLEVIELLLDDLRVLSSIKNAEEDDIIDFLSEIKAVKKSVDNIFCNIFNIREENTI